MNNLKMECPTCNGGKADFCGCPTCLDEGYTDPPQEILDALECAEIEKELIERQVHSIFFKSVAFGDFVIDVCKRSSGESMLFKGKTKLEALRKAKEWIEGRG